MKRLEKKGIKFCSVCRGMLVDDNEIKRGTHDHCLGDDIEDDLDMDDATQSHGQDDSGF